MQKRKELKTAQDYVDAADREFENANALAAAELLRDAMVHTLTELADQMGWPHDDKEDLHAVVKKLAERDEQMGEILLTTHFAVGGYPDKVRFGYFVWEDGDSHRMLRVVREFDAMARQLAE